MDHKPKPDVRISYNEVAAPPRTTRQRNWKPFAIRTPFLAFVVVCMFLGLVLLQIVILRTEPLTTTPQKRDLRRQVTTSDLVFTEFTFTSTFTSTSTSASSQSTPNVSYYPNPDGFLNIKSTTLPTTPTASPTPPTPPTSSVSTTPENNNPPVSVTSNEPTITVGHPAPDSFLLVTSTSIPQSASQPVTSTKGSGSGSESRASSAPPSLQTTSVLVTVPITSSSTSIIVSNGQSITSVVVFTTSQVQTSASVQTPKPSPTSLSNIISDMSRPNLKVKDEFTKFSYFAAMFLPAIIAVMLREVWAICASGLKMMEPFYLLHQPDGASVGDSLMADYLSSSTTSVYTYSSAWHGNPTMVLIVLINLVVSLLAPLASESMNVIATLVYEENGKTKRANPAWVLSMPLVRTLQGMLAFVAFVIIYMIVRKGRRRSGLSTNPSKIAAMADLLNHPSIVQDLQNIHPSTSNTEIIQALAHNRYTIADYRDQHGNARYGLIKVGESAPYGLHRIPMDDITAIPQIGLPPPNQDHTRPKGHSTGTRVFDVIFIVVVTSLLGVLVAYSCDGSNSSFNNWMNSGEFGPRFVLSLAALSATVTFQHLEREVRLSTPYRELAGRGASPDSTILRSVNGTALSNLFRSVKHGTWFHFFIAVTAILGDVLIIAVTGVPFGDNVTKIGFWVCLGISIFITFIMLLASLTVFRWRHHTKRLDLPQESHENLLRVWMLVSNPDNQLRSMLDQLKDMNESEVDAYIKQQGGQYWAGWTVDRDGHERWCVDKEADSSYSVRY